MVTKKGISSESLDALSPLDGIVLEQEKMAAYRDNDGELHVYSVCLYPSWMYCDLEWFGKIVRLSLSWFQIRWPHRQGHKWAG